MAQVPNERGALAKMADALAEAEVNIDGFLADADRARILTNAGPAVVQAFNAIGLACTQEHVFHIRLGDKPGQLAAPSRRLAEAGVNIETAFGTTHGADGDTYLCVSDPDHADAIIRAAYPDTPARSPRLHRI